jgi:hypothetical protein
MRKTRLSLLMMVLRAGTLLVVKNFIIIPEPSIAEVSVDTTQFEVVEPSILYGMVVDNYTVIEDKIKRNDRLGDILGAYNVSPQVIHQVSQLSRNIFDVRKIVPNRKYTLICDQDSLQTARAFVYEPNLIDYIVFRLGDSLSVDVFHREVAVVEKSVAGVIESNLSETIEELGISHELTNRFVDIFGWQVDFQRLQKGDKFKLIYEEAQVEGVTVEIRQIVGIYFEHSANPYYAFPFDQGEGIDYFDDDGNSLRKALLKYPIEFTRISSRYTMNRFFRRPLCGVHSLYEKMERGIYGFKSSCYTRLQSTPGECGTP